MTEAYEIDRPFFRRAEVTKYELAYYNPRYHMSRTRRKPAVAELRSLRHRGSYLDVSCGRGEMLGEARNMGFRTVAGTEVVSSLCGGKVVEAWAWELPFPDRSFEVTSFLDVIEHLLPGDDELACRELQRVTSKVILLTANNESSPLPQDKSVELHVNRRPYGEWHELLTSWFRGHVRWLRHRQARGSEMWRVDL